MWNSSASSDGRRELPLRIGGGAPVTLLRFLGAFLAASVVVTVMLVIAVELWGGFRQDRADDGLPEAHPVELLVGYDSLDVAELLGEPRRRLPELEPPPPAIPPVEPPAREIRGFVQVELEVDGSGQVVDARVLGAAPAGVYERDALAIASREAYPAGEPGVRVRVIEFAVSDDD